MHPDYNYSNDYVHDDLIAIRVVVHLLMPFILLYGLYVQFHGEYSPGGGFQAGVICAAAFIAHALANDIEDTAQLLPPRAVFYGTGIGALIYAVTGIICMAMGGQFLEYNVLASDPVTGQHIGMFAIEAGVGITVFSVITLIIYMFGGQQP